MTVLAANPNMLGMDYTSTAVFDEIFFLDWTVAQPSMIRFSAGSDSVTFYGSGFRFGYSFGEPSDVTGGTLNRVSAYTNGVKLFDWSGLNVSAATFADLLLAGNWGALNNLMLGGDDVITATKGEDAVNGFGGDDVIRTYAGEDRLNGGAGADDLSGGQGRDTMTGGDGRDDFIFNTALDGSDNVDRITDFRFVDDTIVLDDIAFKGLAKGVLAASRFAFGTKATDAADRIIYNKATGQLWFDRDGEGGAAKVQFADLVDGTPLAAADFLVI